MVVIRLQVKRVQHLVDESQLTYFESITEIAHECQNREKASEA